MTRAEFQKASQQVSLYGNLLMGVTGCVALATASALLFWAGPMLTAFGNQLRTWLHDEGAVGVVGGLVGGVVLAPFLLIPGVPALWVDRRFGLKCPGCGRSVTLRCRGSDVLRTGRCCRCRQVLFPEVGSELQAEQGAAPDRPRE